mmetsp:Transcript_68416/g.151523  ORF Transcript_68416/g.151523 Transcript_68416/m.151523 type:complete len:211 (+) Transcript_68416:446-1078(+)
MWAAGSHPSASTQVRPRGRRGRHPQGRQPHRRRSRRCPPGCPWHGTTSTLATAAPSCCCGSSRSLGSRTRKAWSCKPQVQTSNRGPLEGRTTSTQAPRPLRAPHASSRQRPHIRNARACKGQPLWHKRGPASRRRRAAPRFHSPHRARHPGRATSRSPEAREPHRRTRPLHPHCCCHSRQEARRKPGAGPLARPEQRTCQGPRHRLPSSS